MHRSCVLYCCLMYSKYPTLHSSFVHCLIQYSNCGIWCGWQCVLGWPKWKLCKQCFRCLFWILQSDSVVFLFGVLHWYTWTVSLMCSPLYFIHLQHYWSFQYYCYGLYVENRWRDMQLLYLKVMCINGFSVCKRQNSGLSFYNTIRIHSGCLCGRTSWCVSIGVLILWSVLSALFTCVNSLIYLWLPLALCLTVKVIHTVPYHAVSWDISGIDNLRQRYGYTLNLQPI